MKIKEIKLYGFKSFQEETKFLLNPGITAFVGPNGSGKSNIFDALRWVFGEQSMKALRCEKNEDLIHISADGQSDSNFAEVTVTIENEDFFPQFGSEFEIKRKFYRDGESEFYLNRVKCRLQDIQALFLNSGTLTYSFLELSEIERIISGDTKEMFDDVSGILKYQERREQTQRRLEQTEQDLLRLEDVISEMERTVRSLKRQARQTQLYQELKEEYKKLSLIITKSDYERTINELKEVETSLHNLNQQKQNVLIRLNNLDEERQKLKNEFTELETKKRDIVTEITNLNNEIDNLQQELNNLENETRQFSIEYERKTASLKEKQEYLKNLNNKIIENERKLNEVNNEIALWNEKLLTEQNNLEKLSNDFIEITRVIEEKQKTIDGIMLKIQLLKNDLARVEISKTNKENILIQIEKEKEELKSDLSVKFKEKADYEQELNNIIKNQNNISQSISEQQKTIEDIEIKIEEIEKDIVKRQEELNDCRLLIDTLQNRLGKVENIKFIKQQFKERFVGIFRDFLIVRPGYEQIVDLCLYDALNFFIVNDISPNDFNNLPEGRYGFMLKEENIAQENPDELKALKSLTELVEIRANKEIFSAFLSKYFLTNGFEEALRYSKKFPNFGFLTLEGCLFNNNSVIIQKGEFGYFQINQRLSEYQSKAESLQNEIVFMNDEKKKLLEQLNQIRNGLEQNKEKLFSLNINKSEFSMQVNTLKNQLNNLNKDIEEVDNERNKLLTEIEELNKYFIEFTNQITENENILNKTQTESEELKNILDNLEKKIERQNKELNQIILKIGILNEVKSVTEKNLNDTQVEITNLTNEIEEIGKLSASEELAAIEQKITELKQSIQEKKERRANLENQIPEQKIQEISKNLDSIYDEIAQLQRQQDEIQNAIMQVNFKVFELNHKKEELNKKAKEEFQTNLEDYVLEDIPEPEQKLNEVKERMARLGEINPLSLSAYEQEKKRLDEFLNQRNDIIAAKQNLLKSIAELDARAKERFIDTFREVKGKFNEVFAKFFEGGEADLILTDPANPLTSDVDIVVRMKGKRIKRINQLSGGERTLLAVSLLLAFYLVKPAPFCILDEIDAPLDDVNVVRFNKFLRELAQHTQVVIITHNRATMEYADYIYGLTMERPGKSKIISTRLEDLEPVELTEQ
ncbi:MAG: chromosome segregation protein SMC [candidate division WOR-3 bacterium]